MELALVDEPGIWWRPRQCSHRTSGTIFITANLTFYSFANFLLAFSFFPLYYFPTPLNLSFSLLSFIISFSIIQQQIITHLPCHQRRISWNNAEIYRQSMAICAHSRYPATCMKCKRNHNPSSKIGSKCVFDCDDMYKVNGQQGVVRISTQQVIQRKGLSQVLYIRGVGR